MAVRIGPTIIGAPHRGHVQHALDDEDAVGSTTDELCEQRASQREPRRPTRIGEKAKLPNANEAAWQDVLDEAPQKLQRGQRHRPPLVTVRVVLPPEGDPLTIERDQPMIADRDAMGIAAEIAQHRRRPHRRPVSHRRPSRCRRAH